MAVEKCDEQPLALVMIFDFRTYIAQRGGRLTQRFCVSEERDRLVSSKRIFGYCMKEIRFEKCHVQKKMQFRIAVFIQGRYCEMKNKFNVKFESSFHLIIVLWTFMYKLTSVDVFAHLRYACDYSLC
jgi:hypothetical protein